MIRRLVFAILALAALISGTSAFALSQPLPAQAAGESINWGVNVAGLGMGGPSDGDVYRFHAWSSGTTYRFGDRVNYLKKGYISLQGGNLNHTPGSSPSWWTSQTYGRDYRKNTLAELTYCRDHGFDYHRLQFKWHRTQPDALHSAAFDSTNLGYLDDMVDMIGGLGMKCSICPFDYAVYYDLATDTFYEIGSAGIPNSTFATFWRNMALHYQGRTYKPWAYDLMNEPNSLSGGSAQWFAAAQAAITAIRTVDTTTPIIVSGYDWGDTRSWPTSSNAAKDLVDPGNNLIFEGHQYFDASDGGYYSDGDAIPGYTGTPYDRAKPLLQPFVEWCRANNKVGLIGEVGAPGTAFWLEVLRGAYDFLQESADVIKYVQLQSLWTCNDYGYSWKDNYCMGIAPYGDPFGQDNCNGAERPATVFVYTNYVKNEPPSTSPPQVATVTPTKIGATSATLGGSLSDRGTASSVQASFEWGPTASFGNTTPTQTMSAAGAFSYALNNLAPSTTYFFRAKAAGDGVVHGDTLTFTTDPATPWDVNGDGKVNYVDLALLSADYGETTTPPHPPSDINQDGVINYADLALLGSHYGETY